LSFKTILIQKSQYPKAYFLRRFKFHFEFSKLALVYFKSFHISPRSKFNYLNPISRFPDLKCSFEIFLFWVHFKNFLKMFKPFWFKSKTLNQFWKQIPTAIHLNISFRPNTLFTFPVQSNQRTEAILLIFPCQESAQSPP
jgi:hypothetical protein